MIAAVMGWSWYSDRSQVRPNDGVSSIPSDTVRAREVVIASETTSGPSGVMVTAHMASDIVGGKLLWPYGRPASQASDATKDHRAIRASKVNP